MAESLNAMEALGKEIERVTELREQYRGLDGLPNVNVKPAIYLMTVSLDGAAKAVGSNDPAAVIRALTDLREYEE